MPTQQIINPETGAAIAFGEADLPMLIHGTPKVGAALFSVCTIAQLFMAKKKVLFFTAYPMGKKEFCASISDSDRQTDVYTLEKIEDLDFASHHGAIVVKSGDRELCRQTLEQLPDGLDRVVFIKNIEELLTPELFALVKERKQVILSGDADATPLAKEIFALPWATQIFFSKPNSPMAVEIPALKKYIGFMKGKNSGMISLNKKSR